MFYISKNLLFEWPDKKSVTRSIAALLKALFADVLLTIVGCGVNELFEAAAVALFDGLFGFEDDAVVVAAAVEFAVVAVRTPDVADRMRYIRAFAVNLFKMMKILFDRNLSS